MNINYKNELSLIDALDSKSSLNKCEIISLLKLTDDDDAEVRYRSFQCLGSLELTSDIVASVRKGLSDDDELVRTECAEILGSHHCKQSVNDLVFLLSDESTLVRSAALISLGQLGDKTAVKTIEDSFDNFNDSDRICSTAALYMLGEDMYFAELLKGLSNDSYQIRCSTANLLSLTTNKHHIEEAVSAIEKAQEGEDSRAVLSTLSHVLEELKSQ